MSEREHCPRCDGPVPLHASWCGPVGDEREGLRENERDIRTVTSLPESPMTKLPDPDGVMGDEREGLREWDASVALTAWMKRTREAEDRVGQLTQELQQQKMNVDGLTRRERNNEALTEARRRITELEAERDKFKPGARVMAHGHGTGRIVKPMFRVRLDHDGSTVDLGTGYVAVLSTSKEEQG